VLERAEKVAKALKRFLRRKGDAPLPFEANGKRYTRAEDWQFIGAFFGHTAIVRDCEEIKDDEGKVMGYLARAEVITRTGGVVSGAESACLRDEPNWAKKPAFQLRSMAQTRACAKALRNVFAWVAVMAGLQPTPAEEMQMPQNSGVYCSDCGEDVSREQLIESKKQFQRTLCKLCFRAAAREAEAKIMQPLSDPEFVKKSVAAVRGVPFRSE
jgi:hypothetical protein